MPTIFIFLCIFNSSLVAGWRSLLELSSPSLPLPPNPRESSQWPVGSSPPTGTGSLRSWLRTLSQWSATSAYWETCPLSELFTCATLTNLKYIYPLLLNQVFKNSREFNFHWEDGTPKSVMKHVSWAVGLVRIFPHLYCRRGSHFHQDHLEICAKWTKLIFISLEDWFHISQRWFEPILPLLCWTEL